LGNLGSSKPQSDGRGQQRPATALDQGWQSFVHPMKENGVVTYNPTHTGASLAPPYPVRLLRALAFDFAGFSRKQEPPSMTRTNPKVDGFIRRAKTWQKEMEELRRIILGCQLCEELKWGKPCYTFEQNNIVVIQPFKEYLAIMFFKGALLKDRRGILTKPGQNTQAGRQIRFANLAEIVEMASLVKAYLQEAIEVDKAGLKVNLKTTSDYAVPDEFQTKLDTIPALKTAFDSLTPGRQRAYILHFSGAKQSKTREARVEKCMPRILKGKGLDD
jgi:uncharacterized protein YdeI (YjbR/CyaY-like superfamily)